ncbi:exosome complex protein Rrp42 [Candidatus Pacearchaeota archaeon]|jgi:exosome complex component RRP42|nr:exosome complex protein Rrp42 [Candidatus Pacearchaeota archaeon]
MITSDLTAERIREYLSQGKRFDGRKPDEFRELIIETGVSKNAEGSARVKIGNTEVLVGVKMDVGTPYADSAGEGNLMVTAEFLPLSSPRIDLGPPQFDSIELARVIDRGIRESHFIELDKLCIKEGEKVWTVYVDIYTINDDGNLLDAAGIGAVAALRNAKVPKFDEETGRTDYHESSGKNIPLKKAMPISLTVHKIGDSLVVDPTREEEDISETRVTMCLADGTVHSLQKGNAKELSIEEFNKVIDLIEKTEKDILNKIENSLK